MLPECTARPLNPGPPAALSVHGRLLLRLTTYSGSCVLPSDGTSGKYAHTPLCGSSMPALHSPISTRVPAARSAPRPPITADIDLLASGPPVHHLVVHRYFLRLTKDQEHRFEVLRAT